MLKPYFSVHTIEAGCDEAGRGCLAGPVFAAAVILPPNFFHPLLNDSKQLSVKKRDVLREVIEREALAYSVQTATNFEIDKINILNASILAMHRAVDGLTTVPNFLLIDGNRFKPYQQVKHKCIVKGDSIYASIAAASVLAKTYRDEYMLALSKNFPEYGWEKNMGYPTLFHRKAIEEYGITPHHRVTFRLTNKQLEFPFEK
jgi:ribonuclease HII